MPIRVAFLRGVNLGSRRRVTNEQLRSALEGAGFEDVACFRASGNVIFDDCGARADPTERVETALANALGIEVVVFLRTARQVAAIAAHRPFGDRVLEVSDGKLQVALLLRAPAAAARRRALALAGEEDPVAIRGRELYWLPRGRMADSELDLRALEAEVGPWTMRTRGTIEQIDARITGRRAAGPRPRRRG